MGKMRKMRELDLTATIKTWIQSASFCKHKYHQQNAWVHPLGWDSFEADQCVRHSVEQAASILSQEAPNLLRPKAPEKNFYREATCISMPMLNMLERGQQANKREGTAEVGKGEAAKSSFFLRLVVLLFSNFGYISTIKSWSRFSSNLPKLTDLSIEISPTIFQPFPRNFKISYFE